LSSAAREGRRARTTNEEGGAVSEERRKVAIAGAPGFLATNTLTMVHLTPVQSNRGSDDLNQPHSKIIQAPPFKTLHFF